MNALRKWTGNRQESYPLERKCMGTKVKTNKQASRSLWEVKSSFLSRWRLHICEKLNSVWWWQLNHFIPHPILPVITDHTSREEWPEISICLGKIKPPQESMFRPPENTGCTNPILTQNKCGISNDKAGQSDDWQCCFLLLKLGSKKQCISEKEWASQ